MIFKQKAYQALEILRDTDTGFRRWLHRQSLESYDTEDAALKVYFDGETHSTGLTVKEFRAKTDEFLARTCALRTTSNRMLWLYHHLLDKGIVIPLR